MPPNLLLYTMAQRVIVIGSGFSGLSAACHLAKAGMIVTVLEKHDQPGGRARSLMADGFRFDMGPSWYWMPDVFERFFACFGKKVSDYYRLARLNPSYRVYWPDECMDIPAGFEELQALFEGIEPGSAKRLVAYLRGARYKYEVGINRLVYKPGQSLKEFADVSLFKGLIKLDVFSSAKSHIRKYFSNPKLEQLMEFPLLFLGALAEDTPALYSLMNYADIKLGTWYPEGGMTSVINAMYELACSLGVTFQFEHNVTHINVDNGIARGVETDRGTLDADVVLASADYHFVETKLLDAAYRTYTDKYWESRKMAPSCLIYYIGVNKRLDGLLHHTLFFDVPFSNHAHEIYKEPAWPKDPLFYVSCTSKSDDTVAPDGRENLFILIPVAPGIEDSEAIRAHYFNLVMERLEDRTGESIRPNIVYKRSYAHADFVMDYNAYKGNAYGLANTLAQTAILKPSVKSRKVANLFYTGQLTVPGPGVPPSIISGEVVAGEIVKYSESSKKHHKRQTATVHE